MGGCQSKDKCLVVIPAASYDSWNGFPENNICFTKLWYKTLNSNILPLSEIHRLLSRVNTTIEDLSSQPKIKRMIMLTRRVTKIAPFMQLLCGVLMGAYLPFFLSDKEYVEYYIKWPLLGKKRSRLKEWSLNSISLQFVDHE